jgi:hypothetical protein
MSGDADVRAALERDMAKHDHVPDVDRAAEACGSVPPGGPFTRGEYAASLARTWLWSDAELIAAIRRGENLPNARLADLLRHNVSLPSDVRDHIAGRLEKGRRHGSPTLKYDPERRAEKDQLRFYGLLIRHQYELNRQAGMKSGPGRAGAYAAAKQQISKWSGIPEETLDKYARPRQKPRR